MKHKISQSLFTYWNELRGERIAPRRFEIEPARIAAILPDTFILECEPATGARFRLAGTRLSNLLGRDVRNSQFAEVFEAADHATVRHALQLTTEQAAVGLLLATPSDLPASSPQIEIVLLPLFHNQDAITRVLGSAACLHPSGPQASTARAPLLVHEHETIWPDGRPRTILQHMHKQSPFAPEHRGARIVSADRRRFRVFDGGKLH